MRCQRVISFCDLRDELDALDIPLDFTFVRAMKSLKSLGKQQ